MINISTGEKVVFEIRRHWYYFLSEIFFLIIVALLPLVVFIALFWLGLFVIISKLFSLFLFLSLGWWLIAWFWFFIIWTNFYLDVWVVTDKRIIDVEQFSLFSRDISEIRLDKIQDVTIEVKGFLPTMLHFGDIHVQTASAGREFIIRNVPNPYQAKDKILALTDAVSQKNSKNNL